MFEIVEIQALPKSQRSGAGRPSSEFVTEVAKAVASCEPGKAYAVQVDNVRTFVTALRSISAGLTTHSVAVRYDGFELVTNKKGNEVKLPPSEPGTVAFELKDKVLRTRKVAESTNEAPKRNKR